MTITPDFVAAVDANASILFGGRPLPEKQPAEQFLLSHFPTFSNPETTSNGQRNTNSGALPETPFASVRACHAVLQHTTQAMTQYFLVAQLKALVLSHFGTFAMEERQACRGFLLEFLKARPETAPFVLKAMACLLAYITKLGWLEDEAFKNTPSDLERFKEGSAAHQWIMLVFLQAQVEEMTTNASSVRSKGKFRTIASQFRDTKLQAIFCVAMHALGPLAAKAAAGAPVDPAAAAQDSRWPGGPHEVSELAYQALLLAKACLSFDFLGTSSSSSSALTDAADDVTSTTQIPLSWKETLVKTDVLPSLWRVIEIWAEHDRIPVEALDVISLIIAARRSIYEPEERANALQWLMATTLPILMLRPAHKGAPFHPLLRGHNGQNDGENLKAFCRLIARSKVAFLPIETHGQPQSAAWLDALAHFTVALCGPATIAAAGPTKVTSLLYLLHFWSRLAQGIESSTTHSRDDPTPETVRINQLSVALAEQYFTGRFVLIDAKPIAFNAADGGVADDDAADDDDDDETGIMTGGERPLAKESMELLAVLIWFNYQATSAVLISCFQHLAGQFAEAQSHVVAFRKLCAKFSWWVDMTTQLVACRRRNAYASGSQMAEFDKYDGQLCAQVLQLLQVFHNQQQQQMATHAAMDGKMQHVQLELAFLGFIEAFRSRFIQQSTSNDTLVMLFAQFSSAGLQLQSTDAVFDVFVSKIGNNLRMNRAHPLIIEKTVRFLHDMTVQYATGRLMRKTELGKFLLKQHTGDYFPFLRGPAEGDTPHSAHAQNKTVRKVRLTYYSALGRLIFSEAGEIDESILERELWEFLEPFRQQLRRFADVLAAAPGAAGHPHSRASPGVDALAVECLFRDLRGLVTSLSSSKQILWFFHWLKPQMPTILALFRYAASTHASGSPCLVAMLRFWKEMSMNRSSRFKLASSAPQGLMLFKHTAEIVEISASIQRPAPLMASMSTESLQSLNDLASVRVMDEVSRSRWDSTYKLWTLMLQILTNSINGRYVNLSTFAFYGDTCFSSLLHTLLSLIMGIPLVELMTYTKLSLAYFQLIEAFTTEELFDVETWTNDEFTYACRASSLVMNSSNAQLVTLASNVMDYITRAVVELGRQAAWQADQSVPPCKRQQLLVRYQENPQAFTFLLEKAMDVVFYGQDTNLWAMSRFVLPLVLLQRSWFEYHLESVARQQPPAAQEVVRGLFKDLMKDINDTLSNKNRDTFTNQLWTFKRDLSAKQITLMTGSIQPSTTG
ncbi:hypothetical protein CAUPRSCDRAFT_10512 [Caulochytrium protostelioides]|nr:hypothetical protein CAUPRSCDRAFT_10512 [Caulochytrium protostelioides]